MHVDPLQCQTLPSVAKATFGRHSAGRAFTSRNVLVGTLAAMDWLLSARRLTLLAVLSVSHVVTTIAAVKCPKETASNEAP